MRTLIFTALIVGCSAICNAQQEQHDTTKVKSTPTLIVKDETAKTKTKEELKFTPPVIVKDETQKNKKQKAKEEVKFTPPVIVKDPEKKQ